MALVVQGILQHSAPLRSVVIALPAGVDPAPMERCGLFEMIYLHGLFGMIYLYLNHA